jgi:hypothetical protein
LRFEPGRNLAPQFTKNWSDRADLFLLEELVLPDKIRIYVLLVREVLEFAMWNVGNPKIKK